MKRSLFPLEIGTRELGLDFNAYFISYINEHTKHMVKWNICRWLLLCSSTFCKISTHTHKKKLVLRLILVASCTKFICHSLNSTLLTKRSQQIQMYTKMLWKKCEKNIFIKKIIRNSKCFPLNCLEKTFGLSEQFVSREVAKYDFQFLNSMNSRRNIIINIRFSTTVFIICIKKCTLCAFFSS